MFIESVIPFNHLILCRPLLLLAFVFPSIRVFSMSQLFKSGGQSVGTSALASFLPMNIQDWFSLGLIYLHWWIRIIKSRVFKICLSTRTLVMSPNLIAIIGNSLINITFPLTSCDAQINLSRLLITQNKSWSIMLAIEKGITKFLSYEKTIKGYAVKKFVAKKIFQREVLGSWGFSGGAYSKKSACNVGDQGSVPESGRSPGEGNGYPLQYSCLENSMARGAWWAI